MDVNVRTLRRTPQTAGRRLRANWPANLRADEIQTSCRVIDISTDGAGLSAPAGFSANSDVWLILEQASPIRGLIVWREKGRMGLRFWDRQGWVEGEASKSFDPAAWLK
jgi:hypothetical protein